MLDHVGFYVVMTEPLVGYEVCATAAVSAGIRMLQLRMKGVSQDEMMTVARGVRAITRGTDTRFIVNDNLDVAMAIDADGVHLGQSDFPLVEARRRWSTPGKLFGLSTHNEKQQADAICLNPDYIGIGPIFKTPTKVIPDPVIGPERLRTMLEACPLPHVCIGGISLENLDSVLAAGARNICAVRAVMQAENPEAIMREFQQRLKVANLQEGLHEIGKRGQVESAD